MKSQPTISIIQYLLFRNFVEPFFVCPGFESLEKDDQAGLCFPPTLSFQSLFSQACQLKAVSCGNTNLEESSACSFSLSI